MSKKTVMAFAQRMGTDAALRQQVQAIGSVQKAQALEDLARVAGEHGFVFSAAELEVGLGELSEMDGELSEMDLESVAGGTGVVSANPLTSTIKNLNQLIKGAIYPCS